MSILRSGWRGRHKAICCRKLTEVAYGLYASRDYASTLGDGPARNDLSDVKIIGFSEEERPLGPVWWLSRAEKAGQLLMRSSSAATRLAACLNGDAVAALPCFQADNVSGLTCLAGPDLVGSLELASDGGRYGQAVMYVR